MRGEGFLALAHLTGILNQIKAVEIDACCDMRGGGPSRDPARRMHRLFPVPLARERRELAMLSERRRRGEMVLGHRLAPLHGLDDLLRGIVEVVRGQDVEARIPEGF